MTEKLKELLECFSSEDIHLIQCDHKWCDAYGYEKSQMKKDMLDYITNLQQKDFESQKEITKLKDKLEQQRKEYQDTYKDVRIEIKEKNERIANLQQENERLKEKLENKLTPEELVNMLNQELVRQNKCYKSRFEKAIEYMKDFIFEGLLVQEDRKLIMYNENLRKFENILNGSDEE